MIELNQNGSQKVVTFDAISKLIGGVNTNVKEDEPIWIPIYVTSNFVGTYDATWRFVVKPDEYQQQLNISITKSDSGVHWIYGFFNPIGISISNGRTSDIQYFIDAVVYCGCPPKGFDKQNSSNVEPIIADGFNQADLKSVYIYGCDYAANEYFAADINNKKITGIFISFNV